MNKPSNINYQARQKAQSPSDTIAQVHDLYEKGSTKKAITLTKRYAKKYHSNPQILVALAALCVTYEQNNYATTLLSKVLAKDPKNVRGLYNWGLLYLKEGNLKQAEKLFSKAVILDPNYTSAIQNLLFIFVQTENVQAIIDWFKKLKSDNSPSQSILLLFVKSFKALNVDTHFADAAEQFYNMYPNSYESNFNFALAMQRLGEKEIAKRHYKEALLLKPSDLEASNNLGKLFFDEGDIRSAINLLDNTSLENAEKPAILHNMGVALYAVGELERAKKYLLKAAELEPGMGDPHYTLGLISKDRGEYEDAHNHFDKAIQFCDRHASMYTDSIAQKWLLARYSLDWDISDTVENHIGELGITTTHIAPFTALPMEDNPKNQLLRAEKFTKATYPNDQLHKDFAHYRNAEVINIAYISADFHQFPGMTLMSGMFAAHDRAKFKVFALSYGPDRTDPMRQKIMRDVDKFIDVKDFTDDEIVALCSNLNIHIAIHRNGYTKLHRTGIFAKRAAPIQINYLGYPSTMGAPFMDYLVADRIIIPNEYRKHYSEKIMYMPWCYQPNDQSREWPVDTKTKEEHGLDKSKITLCCFNNSYKISRTEFSLWMEVLSERPNTQLWLLDPGERGQQNLLSLLSGSPIDSDRIVFAKKTDHSSHLARHTHADIFLDTFNYNAHTTATDALGMGVPVVTLAGQQFSARVGASILEAADLSELITDNIWSYKRKILQLIDDPGYLSTIQNQCGESVLGGPLFNTYEYTQNFEKGLISMFDRFKRGGSPEDTLIEKTNDDIHFLVDCLEKRI